MKKVNNTPQNAAIENSKGRYVYDYPHPALTTDCCVFTFYDGELYILLIQRGVEPFKGLWALPGGFVHIDETVEQCALRELYEETGYEAERLVQFHTYSTIDRDPRERIVSVAFYALVKWGIVYGGDDANRAAWCPISALPILAFDHADIIADALKAMKRDIYFEPLGYDLLPTEFSMSELQRVYEKILDTEFDRRNFYNKMRNSQMVIEVDKELEDEICSKGCDIEIESDSLISPMCSLSDSDNDYCLSSKGKFIKGSEQHRSKPRRSNVKYRFNVDKFSDIFKNSDEPFKP